MSFQSLESLIWDWLYSFLMSFPWTYTSCFCDKRERGEMMMNINGWWWMLMEGKGREWEAGTRGTYWYNSLNAPMPVSTAMPPNSLRNASTSSCVCRWWWRIGQRMMMMKGGRTTPFPAARSKYCYGDHHHLCHNVMSAMMHQSMSSYLQ